MYIIMLLNEYHFFHFSWYCYHFTNLNQDYTWKMDYNKIDVNDVLYLYHPFDVEMTTLYDPGSYTIRITSTRLTSPEYLCYCVFESTSADILVCDAMIYRVTT